MSLPAHLHVQGVQPLAPHDSQEGQVPERVTTEDVEVAERLEAWRAEQPTYGCSLDRATKGCLVLVVIGIIVISYVPYIVLNPNRSLAGVVCGVVLHLFLLLTLASFIQIILIDPGTVPDWWHEAVCRNHPHSYPICKKSRLYKPPRSHFDSVSRRLVLNMDHFCPWVANTVGFYNRKFFILFVVYAGLTCLWVAVTLPLLAQDSLFPFAPDSSAATPAEEEDGQSPASKIMFRAAFVLNCMFGALLPCLACFHVKMVLFNETTIDGNSLPQYNMGYARNWEQVFGSNPLLWMLPVWGAGPAGDGVRWPRQDGTMDGLV